MYGAFGQNDMTVPNLPGGSVSESKRLHPADVAIAAQIVSQGSVLPSCAALIRPIYIKRPSKSENLTRIGEIDSAYIGLVGIDGGLHVLRRVRSYR